MNIYGIFVLKYNKTDINIEKIPEKRDKYNANNAKILERIL